MEDKNLQSEKEELIKKINKLRRSEAWFSSFVIIAGAVILLVSLFQMVTPKLNILFNNLLTQELSYNTLKIFVAIVAIILGSVLSYRVHRKS
jgi:uncharacterized membrane protein